MDLWKEIKEKADIVIYGAVIITRALLKILPEDVKCRVRCIAVTTTNNNVKELDGFPICNIENVVNMYPDPYILISVRKQYWDDIIATLISYDIKKYTCIGMQECIEQLEKRWKNEYPQLAEKFVDEQICDGLSEEEYVLFLSKQINDSVLNFEVNLVDHCNLNCHCCNHFSPIAEKYFLDCEEYERDISRIATLYKNRIGRMMLLGGEPLLHPHINNIMQITRKYLYKEEIVIVSNGLLLPKMSEDFWKQCNLQQVGILLTKYPISFDYKNVEKIAEKYGVNISYTFESKELKTTYHLPLKPEGGLNPYRNYMKCNHANNCVVLREGRLYTCPLAACVHHFNQYFNKSIPEKEVNSIDIHQELTQKDLEKFLNTPIPMCEYCDIYGYQYDLPWAISKRSIEEWT